MHRASLNPVIAKKARNWRWQVTRVALRLSIVMVAEILSGCVADDGFHAGHDYGYDAYPGYFGYDGYYDGFYGPDYYGAGLGFGYYGEGFYRHGLNGHLRGGRENFGGGGRISGGGRAGPGGGGNFAGGGREGGGAGHFSGGGKHTGGGFTGGSRGSARSR